VFLQTDVEFIAEEMLEIFLDSGHFISEEIAENPFEVRTEREIAVEKKGRPVFRCWLKRK